MLIERRVCNVYGTNKDIKHVHILVTACDVHGTLFEPAKAEPIFECEVDVSPRALHRLNGFLERATHPTPKHTKTLLGQNLRDAK